MGQSLGKQKNANVLSPHPGIPLAISGDYEKFVLLPEFNISAVDAQHNTVLHGLFTTAKANDGHKKILRHIATFFEGSEGGGTLIETLQSENDLGCGVLWIGVAYQSIALLDELKELVGAEFIKALVQVPNKQGDTGILAACSRGGEESLKWLNFLFEGDGDGLAKLLGRSNKNGTDIVQTAVSGRHADTLKILVKIMRKERFGEANGAGLYPLHVAAERDCKEVAEILLGVVGTEGTRVTDKVRQEERREGGEKGGE